MSNLTLKAHTHVLTMLQGHEAGTGPFVYNVGTFKKPRRKTPTKTSLENISWRYLYYFAIIPIRSTCTMWPNYPVTEPVGTAFTEVDTVAYSRVSQNLEFDHFTLLIGRARWRNVPKFTTHVQGLCFSH